MCAPRIMCILTKVSAAFGAQSHLIEWLKLMEITVVIIHRRFYVRWPASEMTKWNKV